MMINRCRLVTVCTITWHIISVTSVSPRNLTENSASENVNEDPDMVRVKEFGAFYSFNETIELFTQTQYENNTKIQGLLKTFQRHCPFNEFIPMSQKTIKRSFPFIVVEGMPRNTRNIVTKKLARKVRGRHVFNPPAYMLALGENFNLTHRMRRAYFTLAVYGTACEIEHLIKIQPIVTTGYWIDQTAFSIVLSYPNGLPPDNSPIYQWPLDLLAPDIIFFVNPPITTNTYMGTNEYRTKKTDIFRLWREPRVIEINTTRVYNEIVNIIINHLNTTLDFTFDY